MFRIIDFREVRVEKLSKIHNIKSFDCGDEDINDFLINDALAWQEKKLNVTFIFIYNEGIIGFFCCSGDSIRLNKPEKTEKELDGKHIPEYPAMKIGRLGRDKKYKGQQLGEKILKFAIGYAQFISEKLGIRFITVDAYPDRVKWYEKFGFIKNLHDRYLSSEHVSMRYDLYNPPE